MSGQGLDPRALNAWLSARSIARGLPAPVADYGGYRVDINADAEVRRWVFPKMCAGLVELAHSINEPRHFLKLCGESDELRSVLPHSWALHAPSYFMQASGKQIERPLAAGYTIETDRNGQVVEVRVRSSNGELTASGYAAETQDAFIYDRIVTSPEHRRKGLGNAVMAALHQVKQHQDTPEFLVATEDGRSLYATMGWRTISPYSTASIVSV
jgi:GNAT superfamily N-acetyltransferase